MPRTDVSLARRPDRVDDRLVEQAVAHLRRLVVTGQVETLVAAGDYLIDEFYGGIEEARSRNPVKAASLARLVDRAPEFGMTATTIKYAVPLTLLVRELGAPLAGRLGVSRLRALLPVRDDTRKKVLAESAATSGWTVEKLKARVRQADPPHAGGRPGLPALERAVTRIARVVEAETDDAARLREGLDGLAPARARALLARVERVQAAVERVERLLQRAAIRPA